MLTKEEIKNLRIGDEIYIFGKKDTIISLDLFDVVTTNASCMITTNKLSLNPPKTKKKYWLWAVKWSESDDITNTSIYYDNDMISETGEYNLNQYSFCLKIKNTMIEIEVEND